jgi:UDP-GlcNAc:undecaprenyl-phosphate GlcNAc-1-phosphate transferase
VGIFPLVIRLAHRIGAVDRPGGRRVHNGNIPRIGGIGIYLGFVAGVGAATLLAGRADSISDRAEYSWIGLAVGVTFIFLAGLADDIWQLRPASKLLLQVAAASLAIMAGFQIHAVTLPFIGVLELGAFSVLITMAWILLITNAINLIDGLDGLAGGIALIITATVASVALTMGRFGVVISGLALAGALIGFLKYNFTPARIFMGDSGSQFLGYVIAVISIRGSQKGATIVAILVPLLVLGLPILDLTTAITRRVHRDLKKSNGINLRSLVRSVGEADREHLHHKLLQLGMSTRKAVLSLYCIAALFALSGYLSLAANSLPLAVLILILTLGVVALIKFLLPSSQSEVGQEEASQ